MVVAHGDDTYAHAAKVEEVLLVEGDVRLPELCGGEQLGVERREAHESRLGRRTVGDDFLLLILRADHLRAGREAARAHVVLRMKVCRRQVELRRLAHLLHLANDRLAVARAQPRVDDQRPPRADDDPDVRDLADVEVRDHVNVLRDLLRRVLPHHRRRRRRARPPLGERAGNHRQDKRRNRKCLVHIKLRVPAFPRPLIRPRETASKQ